MATPTTSPAPPPGATGVVVFADGRVAWGQGFGAEGEAVGELCFNTAMTGYQEVMTDPSYARQVVAFTFPHIGNVGANDEDVEADDPHALGCIVREAVTSPSNFRSQVDFPEWMKRHQRIGIAGLDTQLPLFGICLGHQLLALAVGGKTSKMFQGHRGANHPVKRLADGAVEITAMNHGFAVSRELPADVRETHVSLFDGSNCGIELEGRPAFSVQYHPEASPGPQDSFYLFERFVGMMR